MTLLRHTADFCRQIWYAIDTANALQHGATVSEKAQRHTAAKPSQMAQAA